MSQEKVNRYKEEKANRKKNLAKQKKQKMLKTIGGIAASVFLIVAIVFSAKLLRGDFTEEPATTYSEEYLSSIKAMFDSSSSGTSTTPNTESESTTTGEESTTLAE